MKPIAFIVTLLIVTVATGQQPKYTSKHFVHSFDTSEFKVLKPSSGTGLLKSYLEANVLVWDIDEDSTTFVKGGVNALLFLEGQLKDNKREGVFNIYLIDSLNHKKLYKLWEQSFKNDKLNGQWKCYTLHGKIANFQTYTNDSLNGLSRNYWIDGKSVVEEMEYSNGRNQYLYREFFKNAKPSQEIPFYNGKVTGLVKKYYESGVIKETAEFKNGLFHGNRKYYYPTGQLWIEQEYKEGKSWTIIGNYTKTGQKRDPGTLKDGTGTVIFYNDDGAVREVVTYINGSEKK